jgi:hypothetical protein
MLKPRPLHHRPIPIIITSNWYELMQGNGSHEQQFVCDRVFVISRRAPPDAATTCVVPVLQYVLETQLRTRQVRCISSQLICSSPSKRPPQHIVVAAVLQDVGCCLICKNLLVYVPIFRAIREEHYVGQAFHGVCRVPPAHGIPLTRLRLIPMIDRT